MGDWFTVDQIDDPQDLRPSVDGADRILRHETEMQIRRNYL